MRLTEVFVRRPVLASVVNLLILIVGLPLAETSQLLQAMGLNLWGQA